MNQMKCFYSTEGAEGRQQKPQDGFDGMHCCNGRNSPSNYKMSACALLNMVK